MATVRVIVTSREGDVEVEVHDQTSQLGARDHDNIDRLLVDAVTKVRRAYGIEVPDA